ncbi:MAG: YlbF family regulator [Ruminococcus sp.]|nr:YlbF family regulator [Ruminococcus sp.]MCR5075904.1 YlbF family regulator [Ruminococcus sp.]
MDIIEMTRELGKALQADDRYIAYALAKQANDEDLELQALINGFEKMRYDLNMELTKENKDTEKIQQLDENIKSNYQKIMSNPRMIVFTAAQKSLESLVENMQQIITMSANGEDPATCEPSTGCTGSCATCGGCH